MERIPEMHKWPGILGDTKENFFRGEGHLILHPTRPRRPSDAQISFSVRIHVTKLSNPSATCTRGL